MKYYETVLLRSSAPSLTYASDQPLSIGSVVSVPLKTTLKEAVVITEVEKPAFEAAQIASVSDKYYTKEQREMAKFISEYYFSSFSEAISLFIPYKCSVGIPAHDLRKVKTYQSQAIVRGQECPRYEWPKLTAIQQKVYAQLLKKDKALLFGVTGSGKTEIFIS